MGTQLHRENEKEADENEKSFLQTRRKMRKERSHLMRNYQVSNGTSSGKGDECEWREAGA